MVLRRARIAKGAGVTVSEVNQLMERFAQAQKMMKKLARARCPACPVVCRCPVWRLRLVALVRTRRATRRRRLAPATRRSGAAQEAAAAKAQQARAGAAFGQQAQNQEMDLSSMNLPKGFEKFLQ